MENKSIIDRIRQLAYEKYLYRMENEIFITTDRLGNIRDITAEDDWAEAQDEIIREEKKKWQ